MDKSQKSNRLQIIKAILKNCIDEIERIEQEEEKETKPKKASDAAYLQMSAKLFAERDLYRQTRFEAKQLREKFKLKTDPHYSRVLQYRATKDPSVFDGLKREWE